MSALGMAGTAAGRVLPSCLAGSRDREEGATWRRQGERGKIRDLAWAGVSVAGTERREQLSRHSCSPSKRHLWPGCPWSRGLGAELGALGAGAEQTCPGPPAGSVLCGPQAPGWRPLCLRHAGAIPKHAPAQPGKPCQPAGSVLPTDFACSSYFPLLSLAPLREPAPGFVCFNPPCAKLLPLCGVPSLALGEVVCRQHSCLPPTSCHWVMSRSSQSALRHEFLQPLPTGFVSFPPCRQKCPPRGPLLAATGASALLRAVTGY